MKVLMVFYHHTEIKDIGIEAMIKYELWPNMLLTSKLTWVLKINISRRNLIFGFLRIVKERENEINFLVGCGHNCLHIVKVALKWSGLTCWKNFIVFDDIGFWPRKASLETVLSPGANFMFDFFNTLFLTIVQD